MILIEQMDFLTQISIYTAQAFDTDVRSIITSRRLSFTKMFFLLFLAAPQICNELAVVISTPGNRKIVTTAYTDSSATDGHGRGYSRPAIGRVAAKNAIA